MRKTGIIFISTLASLGCIQAQTAEERKEIIERLIKQEPYMVKLTPPRHTRQNCPECIPTLCFNMLGEYELVWQTPEEIARGHARSLELVAEENKLKEENMNQVKDRPKKTKVQPDTVVKVFPNPGLNQILFEWKPTEQFVPERLTIMDLQGKVMFETQLRGTMGSYVCDVQKLARGAYLYRLSGSGGRLLSSGKILLK